MIPLVKNLYKKYIFATFVISAKEEKCPTKFDACMFLQPHHLYSLFINFLYYMYQISMSYT